MSTTYAGTPTYPTEVTVPQDGDNKPAASVGVGLEGLADRTAYSHLRGPGGSFRPNWHPLANERFAVTTSPLCWAQDNVTDEGVLVFVFDFPRQATITQLVARVHPTSGHAALPATKPRIQWVRQPLLNNADAEFVAGQDDESADVTAYELGLGHNIILVLDPVIVVSGQDAVRYFAWVTGEAGANSQTGLKILDVYAVAA